MWFDHQPQSSPRSAAAATRYAACSDHWIVLVEETQAAPTLGSAQSERPNDQNKQHMLLQQRLMERCTTVDVEG
jgi:hypothetical protein